MNVFTALPVSAGGVGLASRPTVTPPVVLTIAGSDSGGGAGIQADLKTFAAHGVYGTSALTAVTAQHTLGVLGVVALEPAFVVEQVEAVVEDLHPVAVKTGMLANPTLGGHRGRAAARGLLPNLVVDPVLVSTSGHQLMDDGGIEAYRRHLIPRAMVVTPNVREAALLSGRDAADLGTVDAMAEVAEELRALGPAMVVVKGGHYHGDPSVAPDVVAVRVERWSSIRPRVATANDHGNRNAASAAIVNLALDLDPLTAITAGQTLRRAGTPGRGVLAAGCRPRAHPPLRLVGRGRRTSLPRPRSGVLGSVGMPSEDLFVPSPPRRATGRPTATLARPSLPCHRGLAGTRASNRR